MTNEVAAAAAPEGSADAAMADADNTANASKANAPATDDKSAEAAAEKVGDSLAAPADDDATREKVRALVARLRFFFSDANLRTDRWMCQELQRNGCLTLDSLLRFKTIKNISSEKGPLARAAGSEELQGLIAFDEARGEVRRVVPFDPRRMGDGSHLSLRVTNVPLTKPPEAPEEAGKTKEDEIVGGEDKAVDSKEEDGKKEPAKEAVEPEKKQQQAFRPRYAVTRDEVKALFEPYGPIGIIHLLYGPRPDQDAKGTSPHPRDHRQGRQHRNHPLGVAIVEFEREEALAKACADLIASGEDKVAGDNPNTEEENEQEKEGEDSDKNEGAKKGEEEAKKEGSPTVLELKGHKLVVERMKPQTRGQHNGNSGQKKRPRDEADSSPQEEIKFEPVVYEWEKGCVLSIGGLSPTDSDREAIREAVSGILGVSTNVRESGLYVDYNRGDSTGHLRLKEPMPEALKDLASKLNDGSVTIAGNKLASCQLLEGEEEEKYWRGFTEFLNNRKRMRLEEKRQRQRQQQQQQGGKRKKFGGRGGRGGHGHGRR